jgi:hypothetical protein
MPNTPRPTAAYLGAKFLRDQWIWNAIDSWLQDVDLTTVIEIWWLAQAKKAAKEELHQKRLQDPNDLYGKSAEYCNEFYAKREAQLCE